jgi:hypothetical protein
VIRPLDQLPKPNEAVHITTGERARITGVSGTSKEGVADISLRLLPHPRVTVSLAYDADVADLNAIQLREDSAAIRVVLPGRDIEVAVRLDEFSIGRDITASGMLTEPCETSSRHDLLRSVEFLLFNFVDFLSPVTGETRRYRRSVKLACANWNVTISAARQTLINVRALEDSGGYGITHTGRVECSTADAFAPEAGKYLLEGLHYFLSFARGMWTGPQLPVGYGAKDGGCIWEEWSVRNLSRWQPTESWFDSHHGDQLERAFPGFWARWSDPVWELPLRKAIHWYVSANRGEGGIEGSLILAQTALELIAFVHLVNNVGVVSRRQFDSWKASDRIRELLHAAGISSRVPSELAALNDVAAEEEPPGDGPSVLTQIRNNAVHPEPRGVAAYASIAARVDARTLALWYLELVLLRLFSYEGTYANRLREGRYVGEVDPVPWRVHTQMVDTDEANARAGNPPAP